MSKKWEILWITIFINLANILLQSKVNANYNVISSCGPLFPATACTCGHEMYEREIQFVVNCTNAGLNDTSLLESMPNEVDVLIFTGNNLKELPWNIFGNIDSYKKLKVVDMSRNQITEIRGKTYHHVQNVERLMLNHNNISIARSDNETNHHHPRVFSNFINLQSLHLTNAFQDNLTEQLSEDLHDIFVNSQLMKLQKLHLEQNEISKFKDRKVFCDLPSLRDLHLGDNLLKDINFEVRCLKNLRFLDLERNKFEYVRPFDLRTLNDLENQKNRTTNLVVDFNLNPFVCDCDISPFQVWMQSTNVTVRNQQNLLCYHKKRNPLPITELKLSTSCTSLVNAATLLFASSATTSTSYPAAHFGALLQHDDVSSTSLNGHTATLIFLLIVLSMVLLGLLVALAYISRDKLKFMISPVFDNVAKKVQYTTIKDEDCPEVHV